MVARTRETFHILSMLLDPERLCALSRLLGLVLCISPLTTCFLGMKKEKYKKSLRLVPQ